MATLNEITGALIEMNAHTESTDLSVGLMFIGFIIATIAYIVFINYLGDVKRYVRQLILSFLVILVGLSIFIFGYNRPKDKIISFCANGPVSIEEISALYDVIEIDGKLIKVKER